MCGAYERGGGEGPRQCKGHSTKVWHPDNIGSST